MSPFAVPQSAVLAVAVMTLSTFTRAAPAAHAILRELRLWPTSGTTSR